MSEEKTLGQLVTEVTNQMSEILRHEVALARAELGSSARNGLAVSGLLGAAGYLLSLAAVMLCVAGGYGLVAAGLSEWLAFLAVAGALVLLALLFGAVGAWRARHVRPPTRAAQAVGSTLRALSRR